MEKQGLKPCPFCGGDAKEHDSMSIGGRKTYYIMCTKDGCRICPYTRWWDSDKRKDAIKAWNRRV